MLERLPSPGPPGALRASCVSRWLFWKRRPERSDDVISTHSLLQLLRTEIGTKRNCSGPSLSCLNRGNSGHGSEAARAGSGGLPLTLKRSRHFVVRAPGSVTFVV